jgi:hypothetical protein
MELQYEKALKQYGLSVNDLPEDAKNGIDAIQEVLKAQKMLEKRGKEISPKTIARTKSLDKWVYYEILDVVNDTDNNDDLNENPDELIDTAEEEAKKTQANPEGLIVEQELEKMYEGGRLTVNIDELKSVAPKTFDIIFDNYDEEEENGVTTSKFSLLEKEPELFELTKK